MERILNSGEFYWVTIFFLAYRPLVWLIVWKNYKNTNYIVWGYIALISILVEILLISQILLKVI